MSGKADAGAKRLLAGDPAEWVRWLLRDPTADVEEVLSGEFQFVSRYSDEILRVRGREGSFILALEVQLRVDPRMPRRMRAYAALAEERYDLPVYPVVLYLLPPPEGTPLPGSYHSEFLGIVAHQDVRVIPVWELDARQVLEEQVTPLIPFLPLMRGSGPTEMQAGLQHLRERGLVEAEVVMALFASFLMDVSEIAKWMRWDMAVVRESPWYRQILEEGLQVGFQQGLQQGLQQGHRESILRLLGLRFDPGSPLLERVARQLAAIEDVDRLRDLLAEAMQTPSLEAFLASLGQEQ